MHQKQAKTGDSAAHRKKSFKIYFLKLRLKLFKLWLSLISMVNKFSYINNSINEKKDLCPVLVEKVETFATNDN